MNRYMSAIYIIGKNCDQTVQSTEHAKVADNCKALRHINKIISKVYRAQNWTAVHPKGAGSVSSPQALRCLGAVAKLELTS